MDGTISRNPCKEHAERLWAATMRLVKNADWHRSQIRHGGAERMVDSIGVDPAGGRSGLMKQVTEWKNAL